MSEVIDEEELDEDDEMIIIRWNLFQAYGKKSAEVAYNIEDYMDETARKVTSHLDVKSKLERVLESIVLKKKIFMTLHLVNQFRSEPREFFALRTFFRPPNFFSATAPSEF